MCKLKTNTHCLVHWYRQPPPAHQILSDRAACAVIQVYCTDQLMISGNWRVIFCLWISRPSRIIMVLARMPAIGLLEREELALATGCLIQMSY